MLTPFWHADPATWFQLVEATFYVLNMHDVHLWFDFVLHALPENVLTQLRDILRAADTLAETISHQHSWAPFPDGPSPLLIRCDDCGLSRLLTEPVETVALTADTDGQPQPATLDETRVREEAEPHVHSWTVMFDAGAEPALVICDCGNHRRVPTT